MNDAVVDRIGHYSWIVMPILSFWSVALIFISLEWRTDIRKRALALLLFGSGVVSICKYELFSDNGFVCRTCAIPLLASLILPLFLNYAKSLFFNRFLRIKQWIFLLIPTVGISLAMGCIQSFIAPKYIEDIESVSLLVLLLLKTFATVVVIYWFVKSRSGNNITLTQLFFLLLFSIGNWTIEFFPHSFNGSDIRLWRGFLSLLINAPFILQGLVLINGRNQEEIEIAIEDHAPKDLEVCRQIAFLKLKEGVENLLTKDEIWRDPDITLIEMSRRLDTNRTYLTEVVNRYYDCNFRVLINSYRLTEATRLLVSKPHFTIAAIAEEAGFSSISTFNTLFRNKESMTPSQYRDRFSGKDDV